MYSGSIEFWGPGTNEFIKGIFELLLLLQEVFEMLEKVVVGQREVW
jgi:hypothetical protein